MAPFLTPPLNQKFSATPKICLKLCSSSKIVDFTTFFLKFSKFFIKFLNFHFEVAQNRGVFIFLGGSSRFGPLQYWVEQFSPPPPFSGPLAGPDIGTPGWWTRFAPQSTFLAPA